MPNERRHEAILIARKVVAENTYECIFESKDDIEFEPGQYAWVIVSKLVHPDPRGTRRALSIISPPSEKRKMSFVFRVRKEASGYKRTLIEAPMGFEVSIEAPFGSSVLPVDTKTPVVFVAGGTGIASFLSMLRDMKEKKAWRKTVLVYANKNEKMAPYLEELRRFHSKKHIALFEVYGSVDWKRLTNIPQLKESVCYLSGPRDMAETVASELMKLRGGKEGILSEEFFPATLDGLTLKEEIERASGQNFYKAAVDSASNHIIFTDVSGVIIYANKAAQQITGYSREEMVGSTPRLWGGVMERKFYKRMWHTIKEERKPFFSKMKNRRKSGEVYTVIARISPVISEEKELLGFLGTEEDITELERIDQAKTEFVSLASHQLRTPLSTINWYTEMLLSGDAGDMNEAQTEYLTEVSRGSKRMVELVNSLLNISRLELGTFIIEPSSTNVIALAKSAVEEQLPMIQEKRITVDQSYSKNFSNFEADPKLFRIILQNLLSNALKYTPKKGKVKMEMRVAKQGTLVDKKMLIMDSLVLMVSDNGYGIPKHQQNKIFTKLFRADNVLEKNMEGTGLGLYIVKTIVDSSGGQIWFRSEENKGTTFYVVFPLTGMIEKEGTKKLT